MSEKSWLLTDAGSNLNVPEIDLHGVDVDPNLGGVRITKQRLRGGFREGVELVWIDNGRLRIGVLPTRGMGVWKVLGDIEIGWNSPIAGPVHPRHVPLHAPDGLGWLEGFDELLVRCGLASNGPPLFNEGRLIQPLHGRIANLPATRVEAFIDPETGEVGVRGVVEESRFLFRRLRLTTTISTQVGSTKWRVRDEVTNLCSQPSDCQLLYHLNVGPPLLGGGSRFVAAAAEVAPRDAQAEPGIDGWSTYAAPTPGFAEEAYFLRLRDNGAGQGEVLLKSPSGDQGLRVTAALASLPCFTLWKLTGAESDGYVTGLEPGTNYPNPQPFEAEQGRVVRLGPGKAATFEVAADYCESTAAVSAAEAEILAVADGQPPVVHRGRRPGWSPAT